MNAPQETTASRPRLIFGALFAYNDLQAVREWVDHLPLDDAERVAGELQWPLAMLNRYSMPPERRLEFLEVLAAPLAYVAEAFCNVRRKGLFPLSEGYRRLARAVEALIPEYLAGYLRILKGLEEAGTLERWLHRRAWPTAAHRAVSLLALMAEAEHLLDRPYHNGLWLDMARVVEQAREAGWMETEVPALLPQAPKTTLEWEYRRIILMAHLHPSRLGARHTQEIMGAIGHCIEGLVPVHPKDGQTPEGFVGFGVTQGLDQPPRLVIAGEADSGPHWALLYSAEGLIRRLEAWTATAEASPHHRVTAEGATLGLDTLLLLEQGWFHPSRRGETRVDGLGRAVTLQVGFQAVHHTLRRGFSLPVWPRVVCAWPGLAELAEATRAYCAISTLGHAGEHEAASDRAASTPARLLDQSAHGLRLEIDGPTQGSVLSMGEVVLVTDRHDGRRRLAELRWSEARPGGGQLLGLRVLCDQPQATHVRLQNGAAASLPVPALAGADAEEGAILLLPPIAEAHRRRLFAHVDGCNALSTLEGVAVRGAHFSVHHLIPPQVEVGMPPPTRHAARSESLRPRPMLALQAVG